MRGSVPELGGRDDQVLSKVFALGQDLVVRERDAVCSRLEHHVVGGDDSFDHGLEAFASELI